MELSNPIKEHTVLDYVFMFPEGGKFAITADLDAGDAVTETKDSYEFRLTAKPNPLNPTEVLSDEETVKVLRSRVGVVSCIKRKQRQPTEEELFEGRKLIHKLAKGTM